VKGLIGYLWLPARAAHPHYERFGVKEWFYRKKPAAPIATRR
jgi:hypothetical protein